MKYPNTKPLLTICCIAYNHSSFIQDSILGFLSQQTNFPIEIIIHDDASSDGTADLIKQYHEKYPKLIKGILQQQNQYSSRGFGFFSEVLQQAQGKYIALCEGDDFWTDPNKLQRQVDFLEANPDFSICFHKVQILQDGYLKEDFITKPPLPVSTIEDLAWGNYIHTCSCVFRNRGAEILGPSFDSSPLGDYYVHMMNAQHGKIYCIDAIMAVYRIHESSLWSNLGSFDNLDKTLVSRKCILADLNSSFLQARLIIIDCIIDGLLFARKEFPVDNFALVDKCSSSDEFLMRLFDRFLVSLEKERELHQMNSSIRANISRVFSASKEKIVRYLNPTPFA
jgi:glycosyltransferase involved in cell wall biosynthesis